MSKRQLSSSDPVVSDDGSQDWHLLITPGHIAGHRTLEVGKRLFPLAVAATVAGCWLVGSAFVGNMAGFGGAPAWIVRDLTASPLDYQKPPAPVSQVAPAPTQAPAPAPVAKAPVIAAPAAVPPVPPVPSAAPAIPAAPPVVVPVPVPVAPPVVAQAQTPADQLLRAAGPAQPGLSQAKFESLIQATLTDFMAGVEDGKYPALTRLVPQPRIVRPEKVLTDFRGSLATGVVAIPRNNKDEDFFIAAWVEGKLVIVSTKLSKEAAICSNLIGMADCQKAPQSDFNLFLQEISK